MEGKAPYGMLLWSSGAIQRRGRRGKKVGRGMGRRDQGKQNTQGHHKNRAHRINWLTLMEARRDQGAYRGLT